MHHPVEPGIPLFWKLNQEVHQDIAMATENEKHQMHVFNVQISDFPSNISSATKWCRESASYQWKQKKTIPKYKHNLRYE